MISKAPKYIVCTCEECGIDNLECTISIPGMIFRCQHCIQDLREEMDYMEHPNYGKD